MFTHHYNRNYLRRLCRWALSVLAVGALAACGALDQRAEGTPRSTGQPTAGVALHAPALLATDTPLPSTPPVSPPTTPPSPSARSTAPSVPARPSQTPRRPQPIKPIKTPTLIPRTTPPAAATAPASSASAWQTYRNDQAGYSVAYPPAWRVTERSSEDGLFLTAFTPATDGPGITVAVQPGEPPSIEPSDLPDRRCERVRIGRLTGTRCFDMIAFSTSTILDGKGKTYIIATTGKHLDEQVYQRFLESFAPID